MNEDAVSKRILDAWPLKLLMQVIPSRPPLSSKDIFYCSNTNCVLPASYQCWFVSLVSFCILFMELIRVRSSRGISLRLVWFDTHGSVHRKWFSRNTNKMQLFVIEFIISKIFKGSCFERHTAHHQELLTVFAASGLYAHMVTGRYQGWLGTVSTQPWQRPVTIWVYKPEAANKV